MKNSNLQKQLQFLCWIVLGSCIIQGCNPSLPADVEQAYLKIEGTVDFNIHVKPILSDKCFQCHGPDQNKRKADLRLDLAESAYGESSISKSRPAIKPGNLQGSELVHRILSNDPDYMMPSPESHLSLSAYEKAVFIKWIEQNAVYSPHWAFAKPQPPSIPQIDHQQWVVNPIDKFVLQHLKKQGLQPSPQAQKELLLRRLSIDLIGLPPSPEEIEAFIRDDSKQAYEKQVDRLLASPHFGEKMAMDWMDLARYADTHGYQVDQYRDMSPWRDWVIKAFNKNMAYDQFITWQLAGDLLPNPTKEQILATGFNRLHPQNLEGGIVDEEFRVAYVADRTDLLGQGLMGLTMSCAKCHDHKFDPISQKEYYQLYSFFNNINESGQISWDGAPPVPTLLMPTSEQEAILAFLENEVKAQEKNTSQVKASALALSDQWISTGGYHSLSEHTRPSGMIAHFELEDARLINQLDHRSRAKMDRQFSDDESPVFAKGFEGKGILLDGDAWLDLKNIGAFRRSQPFSIGFNVHIPKELTNGVLFHKGIGARLYSFKGFHLSLKDNKVELLMAHTWPDNAIVEYSIDEVPKDQWLQFTVTYDGSSKASGYKVYMNGQEMSTEIAVDNLSKNIMFNDPHDAFSNTTIEPGLQFGARWRGKGLGGATIDNILVYQRELSALEVAQLANPKLFSQTVSKIPERLSAQQKQVLRQYYLNNNALIYRQALDGLRKSRQAFSDSHESVKEVMVMKEMPQRRKAYVLQRGLYDSYGEEVFPNTPRSILPMPPDLPKNRLGLAQWITHKDHPLTARVAVNRYWQNYFGRGIVNTTEDFGNQGDQPSHPQLLDWLALEFMNSGWDIKALQKLIVMSATYRQTSQTSDTLRSIDEENIWLARGPSARLSSEAMRDNVLMASGLINRKIGGESVRPYQPDGLWNTNGSVYVQDKGEKLYRRSLYTIWKRTVPHPTLSTFDQPERSECTVRRQKTNTPLQALVLLNDPTYVEAARAMGESITKSRNLKEGIQNTYLRLTGRTPNEKELQLLLELQKQQYNLFKTSTNKAQGWLLTGAYRIDPKLDPQLVAANTVVASAIINSDATITKR